ncbi:MAG: hypothetical protein SFX18_19050 [Pirellulales bacterium]|nr:hypothetical protein [Pirellulales bacterium]
MPGFWSRLVVGTLCGLFLVAWCGMPQSSVRGATPESPDVKSMLAKAMKYLEKSSDERLGGKCLIGLVFVKNGKGEDHPKVKEAVEACLAATQGEPEQINPDIYSTGLATIFLCNLNPYKYREQIEKLLKSMTLRQKACGGWGYPGEELGDTSMTQYGALSIWEATKVGFNVPEEVIENTAIWLIRIQDPSGGWPYKGTHEGTMTESGKYKRINQGKEIFLGVTTASLGVSFICADLLGIITVVPREDDPNFPTALIPVVDDALPPNPNQRVDAQLLKKAQEDGRTWFRNKFEIKPNRFPHYYLYALERYQSFAEAAEGNFVKEPNWYNVGVAHLKKTQKEDGSWKEDLDDPIDTAFACLFLLRSTKKSIEKAREFGAGKLAGGNRLPTDVKDATVRDQKVVRPLGNISPAQLQTLILDSERPEFAALLDHVPELAARLQNELTPQKTPLIDGLIAKFPETTIDSKILILRILGESDQLRHVGVLIRALEDVNLQVRREALDNLERLTKRVSVAGPQALGDPSKHAALVADWQAWHARLQNDEPGARP